MKNVLVERSLRLHSMEGSEHSGGMGADVRVVHVQCGSGFASQFAGTAVVLLPTEIPTCRGTAFAVVMQFPPPLVQATVSDQKLTEPTHSVAWTRALLARYTVHGTCRKIWCTNLKTKRQNMPKANVPNQLP